MTEGLESVSSKIMDKPHREEMKATTMNLQEYTRLVLVKQRNKVLRKHTTGLNLVKSNLMFTGPMKTKRTLQKLLDPANLAFN